MKGVCSIVSLCLTCAYYSVQVSLSDCSIVLILRYFCNCFGLMEAMKIVGQDTDSTACAQVFFHFMWIELNFSKFCAVSGDMHAWHLRLYLSISFF